MIPLSEYTRMYVSESTERPKISHVIPLRSITDRHQKPRNINDLLSNIDRSAPELRATISSNHRQPVARGTQKSSSRHSQQSSRCLSAGSYRAPNGALRLVNAPEPLGDALPRQKAPSAKRCIKTDNQRPPHRDLPGFVRKHRAPKGALRPASRRLGQTVCRRQKAPSAKRCIKTHNNKTATTRKPALQS